MSATKAMADSVLQARKRTAVLLRVAEVATQLEVAATNFEEGAVTAEVRRRIGLATLLTNWSGHTADRRGGTAGKKGDRGETTENRRSNLYE